MVTQIAEGACCTLELRISFTLSSQLRCSTIRFRRNHAQHQLLASRPVTFGVGGEIQREHP